MGKHQEERKPPVIVVKKRRAFSPPSLSDKTDIIASAFTEQAAESAPAGINSSAVETHITKSPARKKKRHRIPRPSHWTREYTHECVEKIKNLFPRLRAEGGGFIPLNIGISNDISAFLAEHPETELTMDEWLCAVSCITSRRVYLQRTAVAGVPRYGLDGHPKGLVSESEAQSAGRRLAILEQKWLRMKAQQDIAYKRKQDEDDYE
ncbi:proQ/FINO family protein [Salmonella enterica]|uniref:ProQ/FINO family protein n=1 Tax=Escherichia fergusonii TaxID=564 RepID=UPI00126B30B1|nr:ProQ/FINO family protein [Escherichia fergusonii]EAW8382016.1 proQ/FINO family protein [Salmonella enterica]ECI6759092.1 proQ/FINO family protein [Salmonella enterica subsp. enterica serovar Mbandaka]EJC1536191.1 proQ/FINO family protein [Salmonella enterica subsp. enterica serovar Montevideo]EAY4988065.1 proQ/FINO family protein [Salmonella enterica]MBA8503766.1 proQ/FINO family protein [Escherichia fergusonii]